MIRDGRCPCQQACHDAYLLGKGLALLRGFLVRGLQRVGAMRQQLRYALGVHLALVGVQVAQDGIVQPCAYSSITFHAIMLSAAQHGDYSHAVTESIKAAAMALPYPVPSSILLTACLAFETAFKRLLRLKMLCR